MGAALTGHRRWARSFERKHRTSTGFSAAATTLMTRNPAAAGCRGCESTSRFSTLLGGPKVSCTMAAIVVE